MISSRNLPQKHVQQHLSAMNIISVHCKRSLTTLQKHRHCEAFKTDTVTAMLNRLESKHFHKAQINAPQTTFAYVLLHPMLPFFHSSQQSCPKMRSKPACKRYSSWPDMGCHGFRPRKWSLSCWEFASHLWDARLFLHNCRTVIQFYTTIQYICSNHWFLMNTSILPPVYTTMPYLGQPGLVFRGVDVPILLHVLRLMILSKIINLVNLLALGKDLKISHTNITWNKHYYSKQICHVTYHIHSHAYYFPNKHSNKWVTTFRVVKLEVPNWV